MPNQSKKHTQFHTKMTTVYAHFQTKTAQKPKHLHFETELTSETKPNGVFSHAG